MTRRFAAVVALLGMSGCTLVVLGAAAADAHNSSSASSTGDFGQALLGAVMLDLTTLAALGVIPTDAPDASPPTWQGGVRTHPPHEGGAP
jgi:hypothetical protein